MIITVFMASRGMCWGDPTYHDSSKRRKYHFNNVQLCPGR